MSIQYDALTKSSLIEMFSNIDYLDELWDRKLNR